MQTNSGKDAKSKSKVSHSRGASIKDSTGKKSMATEPGALRAAQKVDQSAKVEDPAGTLKSV